MAEKMQLNPSVFEKVAKAGAQIVAVTKYFERNTTVQILQALESWNCVAGIGENRTQSLREKELPREKVHFIGRIQSKKIPQIIQYCSVIHSLDEWKHAQRLNEKIHKSREEGILKPTEKIGVFLQINISQEPQKGGIESRYFPEFLQKVQILPNIEILGISGMGSGSFEAAGKRVEFQQLKKIRDTFLPHKKISAGTSRDYEIALEEGIEIVRVGQACFQM
jgi:uncharacterized pyridoxal phosphate-containing UPF0001 family protein